ncbi:hypothetical protein [Enterococcus sp. DIV0212c]|nr:hypothetical protein [Enterococcus sp. DIV0212c]MBO1354741.1 hypothetical protein [Enterococcus sp. DIV0212c]
MFELTKRVIAVIDPEKLRALTQDILNIVQLVTVNVGNPRDVLDLIRVEK